MRSKYEQMSLFDIYKDVENALETDQPQLFRLCFLTLDSSISQEYSN